MLLAVPTYASLLFPSKLTAPFPSPGPLSGAPGRARPEGPARAASRGRAPPPAQLTQRGAAAASARPGGRAALPRLLSRAEIERTLSLSGVPSSRQLSGPAGRPAASWGGSRASAERSFEMAFAIRLALLWRSEPGRGCHLSSESLLAGLSVAGSRSWPQRSLLSAPRT